MFCKKLSILILFIALINPQWTYAGSSPLHWKWNFKENPWSPSKNLYQGFMKLKKKGKSSIKSWNPSSSELPFPHFSDLRDHLIKKTKIKLKDIQVVEEGKGKLAFYHKKARLFNLSKINPKSLSLHLNGKRLDLKSFQSFEELHSELEKRFNVKTTFLFNESLFPKAHATGGMGIGLGLIAITAAIYALWEFGKNIYEGEKAKSLQKACKKTLNRTWTPAQMLLGSCIRKKENIAVPAAAKKMLSDLVESFSSVHQRFHREMKARVGEEKVQRFLQLPDRSHFKFQALSQAQTKISYEKCSEMIHSAIKTFSFPSADHVRHISDAVNLARAKEGEFVGSRAHFWFYLSARYNQLRACIESAPLSGQQEDTDQPIDR